MPTQKLVQNSFFSGQYDRTAQSMEGVSGGIVSTGFAHGLNVVSGPKGELRKRLGTKHLINLPGKRVLVPFRLPNNNDIIFTFGEDSVECYQFASDGSFNPYMTTSGDAPQFPTTGWESNTNGNWTIDTSSSLDNKYQTFDGTGGSFDVYNDWLVDKEKNHFLTISNDNPVVFSKCHIKWDTHLNGILRDKNKIYYLAAIDPVIQYSDDGNLWTSIKTNISNTYTNGNLVHGKITTKCDSVYEFDVGNVEYITPHKYWKIFFSNRVKGLPTMTVSDSDVSKLFISDIEFLPTQMAPLIIQNTPFNDLKNIKYSQHNTEMILTQKGAQPYKISFKNANLTYGIYTPDSPTTLWTSLGFPSSVSFFQNRLWFGGFDLFPYRVIASKFGNNDTFTVSNPIAFDDYLSLDCNQLKSQISNILGAQKVLYAFSEDGISFVDSGNDGMLATNQNIEFNLKNRMPAGDAIPAFKDDVLIYTSNNKNKLYAIDYDLLLERYQVNDISEYAKDITNDGINELCYINNDSELIYGLTNSQKMFALLFKKNAYSGFFSISIQSGDIFDICSAKNGSKDKLLMVTNRGGQWAIEEKLDHGSYIDTQSPLLSSEDKKWATYDNLDKNIALDSYRSYDERVLMNGTFTDNNIYTSFDMSPYVGQKLMLGQINNDKEWAIVKVLNQTSDVHYAYYYQVYQNIYRVYMETDNPQVGTPVYKYENNEFVYFTYVSGFNAMSGNPYTPETPQLFREPTNDIVQPTDVEIDIIDRRGKSEYFDVVFKEINKLRPNMPTGIKIAAISQGRYLDLKRNEFEAYEWRTANGEGVIYSKSENPQPGETLYGTDGDPLEDVKSGGVDGDVLLLSYTTPGPHVGVVFMRTNNKVVLDSGVELPSMVYRITYGSVYDAYAYLKIQKPYESKKTVQQINLSVINTQHLEVGTSVDYMQPIEDINKSSHYDLAPITMNDVYIKVPEDTPEWTKYIILRSTKGLPFTVNSIEVFINYSNMGGK